MKKRITKILILTLVFTNICSVVFAKNGDIIGYAKYSDIAAYINHYPITSYNINDNTAIVAEDLQNYGFNVEWNGEARSLSITKNTETKNITPYGTVYKYSYKAGQNSYPYLETDITAYVNSQKIESFNIDGKTCIYMNDLAPYGEIIWVPEVRALKMWIEDLPMLQTYTAVEEAPVAEQLGLACYFGTDIPKYDTATGSVFEGESYDWLEYKTDFDKFVSYTDLLQNCGYKMDSMDTKYETYIDKKNTFQQRATSFSRRLKKGNLTISVLYHLKTKSVSLHIYK